MTDSPDMVRPRNGDSTEIRMEIRGLILDPSSNSPIVVLRDEDSQVFLPICIGLFEANAIAQRIEKAETPRPMTHDLLANVLSHLETVVEKVVISDLQDNTFFARIHLRGSAEPGTEGSEVDSRPSDAIALAVRAEAPIFVLREVLEKAKALDLATPESDEEKLRKWLEDLDPEDLGKYEM
ncbi:MAG: bifunctional nuclease family protein [Acidobacteriota bacterium]